MPVTVKRQTAYKVWIKDLLANPYTKQEGWDPNYVEINGTQISRVNVLATAVGKFLSEDGNYGALTLDDSTETIRVKAFGPDVAKIKPVEVGQLIRLVGKPREYNDELYLAPEVIRVEDDPNWLLVRKAELSAPTDKILEKKEPKPETEEESPSKKIAELIKFGDKGDGADMEELIKASGMDEEEAKNLIAGLLKSGDVFEPKKGKLKLLE